jgi:heptosyltransferase-2
VWRSEPVKILVLLLPGVGDGLLFTPALGVLRRHFPSAQITGMVMFKATYEVFKGNPNLNRLIYWNFLEEGLIRSVRFVLRLRKERFDVSIMAYPANRAEYNLISILIGAKLRIAHRYNHRFYRSLGFLNNRLIQEDDELHNVEEDMRLLSFLGIGAHRGTGPEIYLDDAEQEFARTWLKDRGLEGSLLVGIHAGCAEFKNMARKRWEKEKFVELGQRLVRECNARVLIFGGGNEEELKKHVKEGIGERAYLVSGTTMKETASLIERCTVFVSNDSGVMHTSAALGVPCVTIFGPTNPKWVHPYGVEHIVLRKGLPCSPCFYYSVKPLKCRFNDYRCITQLTVDEVYAAAAKLLSRRAFPT